MNVYVLSVFPIYFGFRASQENPRVHAARLSIQLHPGSFSVEATCLFQGISISHPWCLPPPPSGGLSTTTILSPATAQFSSGLFEVCLQAVFDCLPESDVRGGTLLVAGDGRYFCDDAIKKIVSIAAGNGVGRVWIGE